jgi:hypothetical protein
VPQKLSCRTCGATMLCSTWSSMRLQPSSRSRIARLRLNGTQTRIRIILVSTSSLHFTSHSTPHTHTPTHTHVGTHAHTPTRRHTHSDTHTHAHTHTHSLSLSHSIDLIALPVRALLHEQHRVSAMSLPALSLITIGRGGGVQGDFVPTRRNAVTDLRSHHTSNRRGGHNAVSTDPGSIRSLE